MKATNKFLIFILLMGLFASCNKKENNTVSDLEKLRISNNTKSYPAVQMDSAQVINDITMQKVQQLLELSTLYLSGNKNTEIDHTIYSQMEGYFHKPDSSVFKKLFTELDSLKVKKIKVNNLKVYKEIRNKDTLDLTKFNVDYFDSKNQMIGSFERNAEYTLVSKENKEFKFYFLKFYSDTPKNDSTNVGVTR